MTFGERIIQLRKEHGYTRLQFAEKIGMPQTTLRNYETNTREPGHSFIIQMAREFNVTTDYLLGLSEKQKKSSTPNESEAEDLNKKHILESYNELNNLGQTEAAKRVEELTEISKYQKRTAFLAARGRNGVHVIELTDEEQKERNEAPEQDLDF
ncbi:helix-turn-helix domain-containing protein [Anaeromassilibacillus senegalensis]|uniref:helix-turn-helix domain-containing protein n=1 Tax=Anaeromassilibacillus senegalensis TaxID=1673717 RepID=UPI0006837EBD|nr:helix-turn-helix domain-containing protein [Anaeromassilibacillus senegalensis]